MHRGEQQSFSAWHLLAAAVLFLLALLPRWYSAQTLGWDWDSPGSFTLVNFDEAGSCRAALEGFNYSPFLGFQTIAIASALGHPPPVDVRGDERRVKAYCHSPEHLLVARSYSALLGALTVVAVVVLAAQLLPGSPGAALFAGALVAVSGFHISQSQSGTVDAASTFFIYAFIAALAWSLRSGRSLGLWLSVPLLVAAVWTKFWVFALFAYAAWLPAGAWRYLSAGWSAWRVALLPIALATWLAALTNADFPQQLLVLPLACYALVIPWTGVRRPLLLLWLLAPLALWALTQVDLIYKYTAGVQATNFGTGYADIGANKWLRNLVNVPAVLLLGLGIPACMLLPVGVLRLWRAARAGDARWRPWLALLPLAAFAVFMAFLAPVTYYRHYLPLIPAAALLIAAGAWAWPWRYRPLLLGAVLAWSAALAWDMVGDYHDDPRRELRPWFAAHPGVGVFYTFYVNPPPGAQVALLRPEYARGDASALRQADYVIMSENWYDTAFANELNGPLVGNLDRLVKTRPEYTLFYRQVLAGESPWLRPEASFDLSHFMPEMLLHRALYGNFQLFVGDLKVFRVRK
ncbi:hypothetical protein E4634_16510 [Mangrovimicrobium sediminis]|uniref:Glycosyltransferase RgtA/B/C/D-like domain-containing protein n=1 Tax=Mangrovimicrobium sediminis TaxID=2562682 RepID=A0A4Z0LWQ5_9GAMM|nr:hypothetical protein [Haliea sp. SAOS-164]TGD71721.1 hypothetical protein E4634_16510 [Haliea sp. SAOS-164]